MIDCGGCQGLGAHRRHCPRHPNYHPWIVLADQAESIGDSIGEPSLANQAWALAGAIREAMPNHRWRPVTTATPATDPAEVEIVEGHLMQRVWEPPTDPESDPARRTP